MQIPQQMMEVPNGAVLKNDVTVQTTAASATVDEIKATMTKTR